MLRFWLEGICREGKPWTRSEKDWSSSDKRLRYSPEAGQEKGKARA